jgi:hypothetical protein
MNDQVHINSSSPHACTSRYLLEAPSVVIEAAPSQQCAEDMQREEKLRVEQQV